MPHAHRQVLVVIAVIILHVQLGSPSTSSGQGQTPYRPAVGKPHFDFVLPAIDDGREVRLSDYRGKKILLFHFASW